LNFFNTSGVEEKKRLLPWMQPWILDFKPSGLLKV